MMLGMVADSMPLLCHALHELRAGIDDITAEEESEQYIILRAEEDENGEGQLVTIEDDDEFDAVADIFDDELFSEVDLDEN